jgi:uncharacterized protein (TIGR03067 family)
MLGAPAPKDKPNTAADPYGLWELESSESDVPAAKVRPIKGVLRYQFNKDGTWVVLDDDKELVGPRPFKFDPKSNPATLDTYIAAEGGEAVQGIYKIKDDKLILCKAYPGKERPKEFGVPTGSQQSLMTFRRVKIQE